MIDLVRKAIRALFVLIDQIVVMIMNGAYSLLMKLSTYNIVSTDAVRAFGQRIGIILGIFMLFTIATQLLNYIISPEKFSDKSQGGIKMIKNIAVSLVLLGTVNIIFEISYKVQYKVIDKQIIPQIIFGVKQTEGNLEGSNQQISYYLFTTMVNVNEDIIPECKGLYSRGFNDGCKKSLESTLSSKGYDSFGQAVVKKDAYKLLEVNNLTAMKDGQFVFNYRFLFSTIIGVITTLILLGFCLDVSLRMVKLYFYQIIAPIPIISNMVPGKGQEMFKKWYKSCISTYLDIFIRLIALFLATYIITVAWISISETIGDSHFLLGVFIILGALMFAKEFPQIIQDLTGIKLDGKFTINPIKKLNQVPVFGNVAGAVGGGIAGARAGSRVGNTFGGAWVGALTGMTSVPLSGTKDGKIPFASSANSVYKKMTGTDFVNFSLWKYPLTRVGEAKVQEIKNARNMATEKLNDLNSQLNVSESMTSNIANELSKKGINVNNLKVERARLEELKKNGNSISEEAYNSAKSEIVKMQEQQKNISELLKYANEAGDTKHAEDLTKQLSEVTAKMNNAETIKRKFETNERELSGIDNSLELMKKYEGGMTEQNILRSEISQVQKDIDDLNTEKRQRERFYDYDQSPQDNINDLLKQTKTKEQYEARVNSKVNKR